MEQDEDDGYVQITIKRETLDELQKILQGGGENIGPESISNLCVILADCGILSNVWGVGWRTEENQRVVLFFVLKEQISISTSSTVVLVVVILVDLFIIVLSS